MVCEKAQTRVTPLPSSVPDTVILHCSRTVWSDPSIHPYLRCEARCLASRTPHYTSLLLSTILAEIMVPYCQKRLDECASRVSRLRVCLWKANMFKTFEAILSFRSEVGLNRQSLTENNFCFRSVSGINPFRTRGHSRLWKLLPHCHSARTMVSGCQPFQLTETVVHKSAPPVGGSSRALLHVRNTVAPWYVTRVEPVFLFRVICASSPRQRTYWFMLNMLRGFRRDRIAFRYRFEFLPSGKLPVRLFGSSGE